MNIIPSVGQVWKSEISEYRIERLGENHVKWLDHGMDSLDKLNSYYNFKPSNELEWLAINEPLWDGNEEYQFIYRDEDAVDYCSEDAEQDHFTELEWQAERVKLLGCDDGSCKNALIDNSSIISRKLKLQDSIMKFCPMTGENKCYPTHALQWRDFHGEAAWVFNPWSGKIRDAYSIASDVFGVAIID